MSYKIARGSTPQYLEQSVNSFIAAGYRPQGNVFTSVREEMGWDGWERVTYYEQPMVKEERD